MCMGYTFRKNSRDQTFFCTYADHRPGTKTVIRRYQLGLFFPFFHPTHVRHASGIGARIAAGPVVTAGKVVVGQKLEVKSVVMAFLGANVARCFA
ncbi:hypothetical protein D3C71_1626490 [compost metagenome]